MRTPSFYYFTQKKNQGQLAQRLQYKIEDLFWFSSLILKVSLIKSLLLNKESKFPSWLNIALGYSAYGMTGGFHNASQYNGQDIPDFTRTRQFNLSPDIDLSRIPVNNKFLKTTLKVLNFIKIPMPAIMLDSQGKFSAYWLYF